ncbi:Holliday junction branch migration protein RuvA [Moraxella nasovis]|uniref:Holliday junction branch migration protein RuvA n=1 Tax=Moraxella nasovis TaxID=2904121 RepID=UPI001F60259B|nr:Holliday junction branch migration protein RuvA [Moraxella nasovis]UNU73311.1 Holliday junction branch migration protein RuvA [Moraxella nasovis]
MIAMITGQVQYLNAPFACIMTTHGVGYEIELPIPAFCTLAVGAQASLFTHLHVREDAQLLFGFISQTERDTFRKLIKITGVGAKMAVAILSTLSVDELRQAVECNNDAALVRVPGIGKKTAQRLVIDLKGKLTQFGGGILDGQGEFFDVGVIGDTTMRVIAEVESALVSLGYKEKEAQKAIKNAQQDLDDINTQTLLKAALKALSGF